MENVVRCSGLAGKKCVNKACGISHSTLCRKHFMAQTIDDIIEDVEEIDVEDVENSVEDVNENIVEDVGIKSSLFYSDDEEDDEEDKEIKKFFSNQNPIDSNKLFDRFEAAESIKTITNEVSPLFYSDDEESDDEDLEIKKFMNNQSSTKSFDSIVSTEPSESTEPITNL